MKKYYMVMQYVYDNGKVVANLADEVELEEKPEDIYEEVRGCFIYVNWFESYREAMRFARECGLP